jgi:hypothetical protein
MLSGKTTASQTIDIIAVELKRPNGKLESEIQKCLVCPETSANGLEATGAAKGAQAIGKSRSGWTIRPRTQFTARL